VWGVVLVVAIHKRMVGEGPKVFAMLANSNARARELPYSCELDKGEGGGGGGDRGGGGGGGGGGSQRLWA